MPDHTRPESVDVEHIMRQIRSRIAERRGSDSLEPQVQQLAAARLEAILDPKRLRPDLLEQLRRGRAAAPDAPVTPAYTFEDTTLFESTRLPLRWIRRLLLPILKLFFNPNPLINALHLQARLNTEAAERDARRDQLQAEWNTVYYEVIRTLVDEVSRSTLEVRALRLKLDSLQGRLEFAERRARSGDGSVQARGGRGQRSEPREREPRERPEREPRPEAPAREVAPVEPEVRAAAASERVPVVSTEGTGGTPVGGGETGEARRRRRRRRRGRRGGAGVPGHGAETAAGALAEDEGDEAGEPASQDDTAAEHCADEPARAEPLVSRPDDPEPTAQ